MEQQILQFLHRPGYKPVQAAAIKRSLNVPANESDAFDAAVDRLKEAGRIRETRQGVLRPLSAENLLVGVVRRGGRGAGTFIPHEAPPWLKQGVVRISARDMHGAHTGDEVLLRVLSRRGSGGLRTGRVEEVIQRATKTFVGSYYEEAGQGFVRIDGGAFQDPLPVGDPGAKGARTDDKVVVEMLRFPTHAYNGEAVLVEVLGSRGEPGVDTMSIIHEFGLPHEFEDDVLQNSRDVAAAFDPDDLSGRTDLTRETIVTIDPKDARDFDDAISLRRESNGHWLLGVHIADVAHFVQPGSRLDDEARKRGTSVYLPDRVIPMLPELISNGLASLQEGKVRFTKSVFIEFTPDGAPVQTSFSNSAIQVTQRFAYEEVLPLLRPEKPGKKNRKPGGERSKERGGGPDGAVLDLLAKMYELAMILRKRRRRAGALELDLPEVKIDLDSDGRVIGAHETVNDESHQIIEEFMLAANVAVATELEDRGLPFLRRVHGDPDERKLRAFREFVEALGFELQHYQSRSDLQGLIAKVKGQPAEHAVNYALLRSLKQAEYSAEDLGHYALAVDDYCHFTSPIRRYPDLMVHRLIGALAAGKKRPPETDATVIERLAKHCSVTERRAAAAERELTRVKLLTFMADRIGDEFDAVITGVESFGVFCRGIEIPAEGMLHVTALDSNDFFDYDRGAMCLTGRRRGKTYRLGDRLRVTVAHVDVDRRELDFRLAPESGKPAGKQSDKGKKGRKSDKPGKHSGRKSSGKPKSDGKQSKHAGKRSGKPKKKKSQSQSDTGGKDKGKRKKRSK